MVLTARRKTLLDEVADAIRKNGGRAEVVAGEIGHAETHARLIEAATDRFGGLDIAVNNAGVVGAFKPLAEITPEEWRIMLETNLTAAFLGARSQIPAMLNRGGAMIFISSFVGTSAGIPGMAAYGASKAALMGLVKGVAADYTAQGVTDD